MRWLNHMAGLAALVAALVPARVSAGPLDETVDEAAADTAVNKAAKGYSLRGTAELRSLAVSDEDPANDRLIVWRLRVTADAFENASVLVEAGLLQRFVAEQGDSGFRMLDTFAGFSYTTPVKLGSKTLNINHQFRLYLPTSRSSQTKDLFIAPMLRFVGSMEVADGLQLYVLPLYRQRFYQYAERAGQQGGMNIQIEMHARFGADYALTMLGPLTVGASTGSTWSKKYASRESYDSPASDQSLWLQDYDWEAHLDYSPFDALSLTAALEQGGPVLRDGIVNTFFVKREETEMVLYITGRY